MLTLTLLVLGLNAQFAEQWVFSSSIGTYTEISAGTVMGTAVEGSVGAASLDDVLYVLPAGTIPWQFEFDGEYFSGLTVSSNGQVILGGTTYLGHNPLSSTVAASGGIALVARDLQGLVTAGTLGEMRYQIVGTAPLREFVIQWKNFKKYGTANNNESYNFQLRLQESTNRIRIVYGTMTVNTTNGTPQVGLRGSSNADFMGRTTTADWNQSTAATVNTETMTLTTSVAPAFGLQYDFELASPSTPPNPAIAISPTDAALNVPIQQYLEWASGGGQTLGYKISFGTDNPPTNIENATDLGNVMSYQPSLVLAYDTDYFWKIIPYNEAGETVNVPVWSFRTKPDPTIYQIPYSQNFNSGSLPPDWTAYTAGDASISTLGGFVTLTVGNPDDPGIACLSAPPLDDGIALSNLRLRFVSQDAGLIKIGMVADPYAIQSFELIDSIQKPGGTAWVEYIVHFDHYQGSHRYIAFLVDEVGQQKIDNVFLEVRPVNDLALGTLGGNLNPHVGVTEFYSVRVRNLGTNPQPQYQVKLMNGAVELASIQGIALAASESALIRIAWTPTSPVNHSLKAVLVLSQDEVAANNSTAVMAITVSSDPNYSYVMGNGTTYANYPLDTTVRSSKYQCIYQMEDLGTPMTITALSLYTIFAETTSQIPVKLWLANTTQSNLSQGFIPVQEFTLVFDGLVNFTTGSTSVLLPFSELPQSFQYNGGNLALMAMRGYTETQHSPQNRFISFNNGWAQARYIGSNLDDLLPGTQGGAVVDKAPKIALHGSLSQVGHLRGTLLDFNSHPIQDITIHLSGAPDLITNQFGAFEFQNIPAGDYTLSCFVLGYDEYSQQISVPAGQVVIQNILPQPLFSVGSVAGIVRNTLGTPIAGAMIYSQEFYTHSNSTGNYVLNLPLGTHTISVTAPEYHEQSYNNVQVLENETTTLDITLVHESDNDDQVVPVPITSISGNFPNPFNPSTIIEFNLATAARARLEIYNLKGQLIKTLANTELQSGKHRLEWNGKDESGRKVSSGLYFVRLTHEGISYNRKMMLMK